MAAIARPVAATGRPAVLLGAVFLVAFNLRTTPASLIVLGLGLGGGFTLGLVPMADIAGSPAATSRLAAMTCLVCYLVASTAPIAVGALHDVSGAFVVLIVVAAMQLSIATRLGPRLAGSV